MKSTAIKIVITIAALAIIFIGGAKKISRNLAEQNFILGNEHIKQSANLSQNNQSKPAVEKNQSNDMEKLNFNESQPKSQSQTPVASQVQPGKVTIEILKQGTGQAAKNNDNVALHYTGTLENGAKFDSSYDRGQPFEFTLGAGQVIKGWDIGISGMKIEERRRLIIPPDLGYGANGAGPIPPNATLIFEVELLKID